MDTTLGQNDVTVTPQGVTSDQQRLSLAGLPTIDSARLGRLLDGSAPILSAVNQAVQESQFHGFENSFAQALLDCAEPVTEEPGTP